MKKLLVYLAAITVIVAGVNALQHGLVEQAYACAKHCNRDGDHDRDDKCPPKHKHREHEHEDNNIQPKTSVVIVVSHPCSNSCGQVIPQPSCCNWNHCCQPCVQLQPCCNSCCNSWNQDGPCPQFTCL